MAKYMIHVCNSREWYVNKYLIPSMLEQGIKRSDIIVYIDIAEKGNLESCMRSFALTEEFNCEGVWHLQDDIIISSDFKKRTEELDNGIVCGFCCDYDVNKTNCGVVNVIDMWYSFPCIRIPNKIATECATWFFNNWETNFEVKHIAKAKKNDDLLFRYFLERHYMSENVILVNPNLVNHVDYLIGGSLINKQRDKVIKSIYWEEDDLVEKLKNALDSR